MSDNKLPKSLFGKPLISKKHIFDVEGSIELGNLDTYLIPVDKETVEISPDEDNKIGMTCRNIECDAILEIELEVVNKIICPKCFTAWQITVRKKNDD